MRSMWSLVFVGCFVSSLALGFDEKDLVAARPGVQHMWHYDDEGAHVCLFKYKYVNPEIETALEKGFPGYEFYVAAVWNENGKQNYNFDGSQHSFRFCSGGPQKGVYGNLDPFDSMGSRIDGRIKELGGDQDKIEKVRDRLRHNVVYKDNKYAMYDDGNVDEAWKWAMVHKLTTESALNAYKVKLDGSISTLKNLKAIVMPFNCAVGEKCWALVPLRAQNKSGSIEKVVYVKPGGEVEMSRIGLTKVMITKLELKQR